MRGARFVQGSRPVIGPISLDIEDGARAIRSCSSAREAEITALLAAGIVKASDGMVTIGAYDPRVQPVQCKRLVGYVSNAPATFGEADLDRYVGYRAALWSIEPLAARSRALLLLQQLAGLHPAFAYPIMGALLASPQVLVLDRPLAAFASQILEAAKGCAVFSTHIDLASAAAFA